MSETKPGASLHRPQQKMSTMPRAELLALGLALGQPPACFLANSHKGPDNKKLPRGRGSELERARARQPQGAPRSRCRALTAGRGEERRGESREGRRRGPAAPSARPAGREGAGRRCPVSTGAARLWPRRRLPASSGAERGRGGPGARRVPLTASQRRLRPLLHSDGTSAPGADPSANMAAPTAVAMETREALRDDVTAGGKRGRQRHVGEGR